MKSLIILMAVMMTGTLQAQESFYDLKAKDITGEMVDFSQFKGKKILIVNTASKCGFTPQYEGLQKLHEDYAGEDFVIIGFPSNDFLKQEPGTEKEIQAFCEKNYGVEFLMMSKVAVKGNEKHPVYQWLTEKAKNGVQDSKVSWNFQKYMISENGELLESFSSKVKPQDEKIVSLINS
ncbi:MAG: glutathione peroxidase [Bacteroidales bacterium]|nr:glutathione peroxidase [Bacteroidales bacterium]